eukprot:13678507-Heterocapsa_arctica.AAC.1
MCIRDSHFTVFSADEFSRVRTWLQAPSRRLKEQATFNDTVVPAYAKLLAVAGQEVKGRGGAGVLELLGVCSGSLL